MTMEVQRGASWTCIHLTGEIDILWVETKDASMSAVFDDCPSLIVVDVQAVTFMDSTGLGFVAKCVKACHANGGEAIVINADKVIRPSIEADDLDRFLKLSEGSPEDIAKERVAAHIDV